MRAPGTLRLVNAFNEVGIGVYRFDHRGHGRSEGERTHFAAWDDPINDTAAVLELATEQNPDLPIFAIGHAMGGYAVIGHGIAHPSTMSGAVLLSPLIVDHARLLSDVPTGDDPLTRVNHDPGEAASSVAQVREDCDADEDTVTTYTLGLTSAPPATVSSA